MDKKQSDEFTRLLHQKPGGMVTDQQLVGGITETPEEFDARVEAFSQAYDKWREKQQPKAGNTADPEAEKQLGMELPPTSSLEGKPHEPNDGKTPFRSISKDAIMGKWPTER